MGVNFSREPYLCRITSSVAFFLLLTDYFRKYNAGNCQLKSISTKNSSGKKNTRVNLIHFLFKETKSQGDLFWWYFIAIKNDEDVVATDFVAGTLLCIAVVTVFLKYNFSFETRNRKNGRTYNRIQRRVQIRKPEI